MGNSPSSEKRKTAANERKSNASDRHSNDCTHTKYDRQNQITSLSSTPGWKRPKTGALRKLSSTKSSMTALGSLKPISMVRQPSTSSSSISKTNVVLDDVKDSVRKSMARSPPSTATDCIERVQYSSRSTSRGSFSAISSQPITGSTTNAPAVDYIPANPYTVLPTSKLCRKMSNTNQKKYCLPANDHEHDRLTNTHYVIKHCFGDNFSAPVHDLLTRSVSMAYSNNDNTAINQPATSVSLTNNCLTNTSQNTIPSNMSFITITSASNSSSSVKNLNTSTAKQSSWLTTAKVLDVACGSGVWVMDMASHYPDSQFYGIDCAPIFPTSIKPPNTYFQQCDVLDPEGLPFPNEFFDYIHMQLVYNSFTITELKFVLRELDRVLKPGGYVELRDVQPYMKNPGPVTESIFSVFPERMKEAFDVDVTWTNNIPAILAADAGLIDIHYQEANLYYGGEGPLAAAVNACLTDPLHSYKDFFITAYDLTSDEWEETQKQMLKEYIEYQSYLTYCMGWGRKPLVALQSLVVSNPTASATTIDNINYDGCRIHPISSIDPISPMIPITPIPSSTAKDPVYVYQAASPLPPKNPPPLVSSSTTATIPTTTTTTATTTPILSPRTSTSNIVNTLPTPDCKDLPTAPAPLPANTDLLESFILENAFDIAHLTDGFTE